MASAPSSGLCSSGSASSVSGSGPWTWTCSGEHGGGDASCSADMEVSCAYSFDYNQQLTDGQWNSQCGGPENIAGDSCTSGDPDVTVCGNTPYLRRFECRCDGTVVNPDGATLVNGQCGSADGTAVASKPTSNLCSKGSASSVSGSGPWSWTCNGSGSGSDASCSAPKSGPSSCPGDSVLFTGPACSGCEVTDQCSLPGACNGTTKEWKSAATGAVVQSTPNHPDCGTGLTWQLKGGGIPMMGRMLYSGADDCHSGVVMGTSPFYSCYPGISDGDSCDGSVPLCVNTSSNGTLTSVIPPAPYGPGMSGRIDSGGGGPTSCEDLSGSAPCTCRYQEYECK